MGLDLPSSPRASAPSVQASLRDLLESGGRSYSFEFFPPRDDAGEAALWGAIRRLERLQPTFVSVTYGAGGTTRDRTVRITERIARDTTLTPVGHLTCVSASVAEVRRVIGQYADAGVSNVLALRGDPPDGPGGTWTPHAHGLDHADELVTLLRQMGSFCVGVAAFPEKHPESVDLDHDARVLVAKEAAGADFAITQMFFGVEAYTDLVDKVRGLGSDLPVIPGLMPITSVAQIERVAGLVGAAVPEWVVDRLHAAGDDPARVRATGIAIATEQARDLLDAGAPGLHFYTLNRSTATLEIYQGLGLDRRTVSA
ncbi:methylenetetrahydrofolate reductase [NAD(P)H] [Angustibacter luteus]|uniref:Methylenetetrahydrofolate reductase n=1 Tax=Angustibacter luteus TaxID=658456 RepID=A0ABW1JAM6_9ACTN